MRTNNFCLISPPPPIKKPPKVHVNQFVQKQIQFGWKGIQNLAEYQISAKFLKFDCTLVVKLIINYSKGRCQNRKSRKFGTMAQKGGGGKKTEMSQFQFGNFENRVGSLFFKNVWIKNSPQTPSKIRRINSLIWCFLMQICLFLCLPKYICFHFDLFEWNLAFSNANIPF